MKSCTTEIIVLILYSIISGGFARKLSDEEYHLLPPLFHLDNYERCLSQPGGLYCLGTFQLTPESEPHTVYNLMKDYSEEFGTFNRTLIRRGYCVSARCPHEYEHDTSLCFERNSSLRFEHNATLCFERNATLRFERCAARWGRSRALRTSLKSFHYCHSYEEKHLSDTKTFNTDYRIVLYAVYGLLLLNFIGTAYDFASDGSKEKNKQLLFWSVRSNWDRLTKVSEDGDTRMVQLSPIQGIRILALTSMLYVHAGIAGYKPYSLNPTDLEELLKTPLGSFLCNTVVLAQVFVIVSTFLSTYNLLLYSQKNPLSFKILPLCVIKRLTRITPLYLLVIGYSATWWSVGFGPQWPAVIGPESEVCRRKFWYQMLYVSNLVQPNQTCLMQTWFLAADIQLNILTSAMVIVMAKWRGRAIPILFKMFLGTCLLASIAAFILDWKPVNQIVTAERVRIMFGDEHPTAFTSSSFTRMHLATWAHLHAAFLGQAVAFLHFEMQEQKVKASDYKWLTVGMNLGLPLLAAWVFSGYWTKEHTSHLVSALYVGLERLVCGFIIALTLLGNINIKGRLSRFFGWRGWGLLGRVSLAVMLTHWCINLIIISSRSNLMPFSRIGLAADAVATTVLTYLVAVPLTILVEMPMQKSLDHLIFNVLLKFK